MMAGRVPNILRTQYAVEDFNEVVSILGSKYIVQDIMFRCGAPNSAGNTPVVATAGLVDSRGTTIYQNIKYLVGDAGIYCVDELAEVAKSVTQKRRIAAADGEDDPDADSEEYNDEVDDTLTDLADTVDDMEELFDDVEEDDVAIDVDNNIADHYIAECDRCSGVFVSAMLETDPHPVKISGVCPLCEKESDQYLHWLVKEV